MIIRLRPMRRWRPSRPDRRQDFGAFGKMTGDGFHGAHTVRAKPLTQRIDQGRASFRAAAVRGGGGLNSICRAGIGSAQAMARPTASKPKSAPKPN